MDDAVWDVTVFTRNRERLIEGAVSQRLLESVLVDAREHSLLSEEHFPVDGTLIQAWAAAKDKRSAEQKITLGADTQYQGEKFVQDLRDREVAPHISEYTQGGNMGKNSLTDEERQDTRRAISQRKRKLIERVFGWSKLDRQARQVKLRGLDRVDWFWKLSITAQNLMRMRRLIPIESLAQ